MQYLTIIAFTAAHYNVNCCQKEGRMDDLMD